MIDPLFWLGLSILLVAVSLTAVLVAAIPALQELGRAARSVTKLAETLQRELPPTLEAIRLTGLEISDLTNDVNEGVKSATQVVQQVDQSISTTKNQVKNVQNQTRSFMTGVKAAWKAWRRPGTRRRSLDRLPPSQKTALDLRDRKMTDFLPERSLDGKPDEGYTGVSSTREDFFYEDLSYDSVSGRQYDETNAPENTLD